MPSTYLKFHLRELEHEITGRILDFRERHITLRDCFQRRIVERHEILQHSGCLVEWTEAIILAHAVLLQEVILEHPRDLQCDLVRLSQCTLTNKLHDLSEILLLLQDLLRPHAK